ncbi:MAG: hypothetical protein GWN58_58265, partial [Anaerolineae bacterium]|nr:hypothetical protein [Anaerolineae bacterium]
MGSGEARDHGASAANHRCRQHHVLRANRHSPAYRCSLTDRGRRNVVSSAGLLNTGGTYSDGVHDADTDRHAEPHPIADAQSVQYGDPDRHTDEHADGDQHADYHAHTHAFPDTHAHIQSDAPARPQLP